jgi:site-specific recombinase XerD
MVITANRLNSYVEHLQRAERAAATIDKYRRSILAFAAYLERANAPRTAYTTTQQHATDTANAPHHTSCTAVPTTNNGVPHATAQHTHNGADAPHRATDTADAPHSATGTANAPHGATGTADASPTAPRDNRNTAQTAPHGGGAEVTRERVLAFKAELCETHSAATVNSALAALNSFFEFVGLDKLKLSYVKLQRKTFRDPARELTKDEYNRLLEASKRKGFEQLNLVMRTICSTGIRVSELKFITAEVVKTKQMVVANKGKNRDVLLTDKLNNALKHYVKRHNITGGAVFVTSKGKPLDRRVIWAQMKQLCKEARVEPSKVFPHNLRHLFAVTFYRIEKDIVKLADILGHSNINTTRIYTLESGAQYRKLLEALNLTE